MDLRAIYEAILEIQAQLRDELLMDAGYELQQKHSLRSDPDFRKVQALAAAYTLQDYLSNEMAIRKHNRIENLIFELASIDPLEGDLDRIEAILDELDELDPQPWIEEIDVGAKLQELKERAGDLWPK